MTSNYTPIGFIRIFLIDLLGKTNIKAVLDVTRKEQYYSKDALQKIEQTTNAKMGNMLPPGMKLPF